MFFMITIDFYAMLNRFSWLASSGFKVTGYPLKLKKRGKAPLLNGISKNRKINIY